jgi:hypothetical protein
MRIVMIAGASLRLKDALFREGHGLAMTKNIQLVYDRENIRSGDPR